jgi:hypothetical protein
MWEAPTQGFLMSIQLVGGIFLAIVAMLAYWLVSTEQGR